MRPLPLILAATATLLVGAGAGIWLAYSGAEKAPQAERPGLPATVRATEKPVEVTAATAGSWSMLAVGDIMLDRHVRTTIAQRGKTYPFAPIRDQLKGYDVVLGNLEGPFTTHASVATNSRLIFTFDPAMAPVLKSVGFTTLSLANNHTLNFGAAGLASTRAALRTANIDAFGDPRNLHGYGIVKTIHTVRIAFIGYHGLVGGLETILDDIREAETRADLTVVMPHWGAEYQLGIQPRLQREARQLIDAGADMIIGAHPHVIEPFEVYKGRLIAYSLGNFLFDQSFSVDTRQGLMLAIRANDRQLRFDVKPVVTTRGQIHPLTGSDRQRLLDRLANDSVVSEAQRASLKSGTLILPRR